MPESEATVSEHSEYPDRNIAELQILGLDLHRKFTILHNGWEMDNDGYITTDVCIPPAMVDACTKCP